MPEKKTVERARRAKRQGKAATTQAGEYVREEMEHAKEGKHPVKSRKQAIAIGLSKARRAGVKVPRRKRSTAAKTTKTVVRRGGGKTKAAKRSTRKRSK